MKIRVSVVVPTYNREKFIERCIRSIMAQTILPYEIIVVDDGSTDQTIKVLESIECTYLRVIKQNHKGAQAARNIGILNANGEYIAFLDSDDEWLPRMLECNIECLSKADKYCAVYADGYNLINGKKGLRRLQGYTGDLYDFLLLNEGPMFQSLLVKKETLMKIGLLDEKVVSYQEWDTSIRIAKEVKWVHNRVPLFIYHLHNGKTISKDEKLAIKGYAYIVRKFRAEIIKRHGIAALIKQYNKLLKRRMKYRYSQIFIMLSRSFSANIFVNDRNLIKIGRYRDGQ